MKIYHKILVLCLFAGPFYMSFGQDKSSCKALIDDDNGFYKGECKKGLAHGEGVYNFSDELRTYEGNFKKGKFNGEGIIYTVESGEKEIVKKGIWKSNVYKGEKKIRPYSVGRSVNLARYTIRKKGEGNKVEINFYRNGGRNNVSNLQMFANYGQEIRGGYISGFENIEYPFKCELIYNTLNKLETLTYEVRFDFTINESGEWEVILNN